MVKIGDIVTVKSRVFDVAAMESKLAPRDAVVIYIHPKNRYFTVRYESGITESFYPNCKSNGIYF